MAPKAKKATAPAKTSAAKKEAAVAATKPAPAAATEPAPAAAPEAAPAEAQKRKAEEVADAAPPAKEAKVPEPPAEQEEDAAPDKRAGLKGEVSFNCADTTPNCVSTLGGRVLGCLTEGALQSLLAGARANVGVKAGRYMFEVRGLEHVNSGAARSSLRVGFSTSVAPLVLAPEFAEQAFFDVDGGFFAGGKRQGTTVRVNRDAVLAVVLNLDQSSPNKNTVSLFCNGKRACQPQPLPEALHGKALFPHVTFRGSKVRLNMGSAPMHVLPFTCRVLGQAAQADAVTAKAEAKDSKCEVVLPVGFPGEGTFDWLDGFLAKHPHFTELSDRKIVEWARLSGLNNAKGWKASNDRSEMKFGVQGGDDGAINRIIRSIAVLQPRNYVVMEVKENLVQQDREATLKSFFLPCYKKVAHVVMGEPPAQYKEAQHDIMLAEKQKKSDAKWRADKVEKKRRKEAEKRAKKMAEERAKKMAEIEARKKAGAERIAAAKAAKEQAEKEKKEKAEKEKAEKAEKEKTEKDKASEGEKKEGDAMEVDEGKKDESKMDEAGKKKAEEAKEAETKAKEEAKKKEEEEAEMKAKEEAKKKEEEESKKMEEAKKEEGAKKVEEATKEPEPESEEETEPPKVELTDEEKQQFFAHKTIPDLTQGVLNKWFGKFSIPEKAEGFDDVRFEWDKCEGSKAYLQKWVRDKKKTTKVEDLVPGQWFRDTSKAFSTQFTAWQAKQKEYKASAAGKADKEKKKKAEESGASAAEGDISSITDVADVGGGEPLFKDFDFEDWALLHLRFELFAMQDAFQKDVNDDDRPGIPEGHVAFYYAKYHKKNLSFKSFGADSFQGLVKLIKDTVCLDGEQLGKVLSCEADDFAALLKQAELHRRDRQRRISAGDETARLKVLPDALKLGATFAGKTPFKPPLKK